MAAAEGGGRGASAGSWRCAWRRERIFWGTTGIREWIWRVLVWATAGEPTRNRSVECCQLFLVSMASRIVILMARFRTTGRQRGRGQCRYVSVPYELAVIYLNLQTPSPRLRSKCPRSPLDTVIRAIWPASGVYVNRVTQRSLVYQIGHLQHSEIVPSLPL